MISQYAEAVGADSDTPLSNIPAERLIVPMMGRESETAIATPQGAAEKIAAAKPGYLEKWKQEVVEPSAAPVVEAAPMEAVERPGPEALFEEPDQEGLRQLWSGVGTALAAPHHYVTEPYVMEPTRKLLEFLAPGITKPIDVPAGAVMPEAEWMGKESGGEITVPGAG